MPSTSEKLFRKAATISTSVPTSMPTSGAKAGARLREAGGNSGRSGGGSSKGSCCCCCGTSCAPPGANGFGTGAGAAPADLCCSSKSLLHSRSKSSGGPATCTPFPLLSIFSCRSLARIISRSLFLSSLSFFFSSFLRSRSLIASSRFCSFSSARSRLLSAPDKGGMPRWTIPLWSAVRGALNAGPAEPRGSLRRCLPPTPASIAAWGRSSKSQPKGGPSSLYGCGSVALAASCSARSASAGSPSRPMPVCCCCCCCWENMGTSPGKPAKPAAWTIPGLCCCCCCCRSICCSSCGCATACSRCGCCCSKCGCCCSSWTSCCCCCCRRVPGKGKAKPCGACSCGSTTPAGRPGTFSPAGRPGKLADGRVVPGNAPPSPGSTAAVPVAAGAAPGAGTPGSCAEGSCAAGVTAPAGAACGVGAAPGESVCCVCWGGAAGEAWCEGEGCRGWDGAAACAGAAGVGVGAAAGAAA
mmetsp:Transcript_2326/g.5275  ORF Transcript_2326/g.5275 Transcript_2326/m.5275 type:complete len:470 (-) Transcript_2326:1158-2567(-)